MCLYILLEGLCRQLVMLLICPEGSVSKLSDRFPKSDMGVNEKVVADGLMGYRRLVMAWVWHRPSWNTCSSQLTIKLMPGLKVTTRGENLSYSVWARLVYGWFRLVLAWRNGFSNIMWGYNYIFIWCCHKVTTRGKICHAGIFFKRKMHHLRYFVSDFRWF